MAETESQPVSRAFVIGVSSVIPAGPSTRSATWILKGVGSNFKDVLVTVTKHLFVEIVAGNFAQAIHTTSVPDQLQSG